VLPLPTQYATTRLLILHLRPLVFTNTTITVGLPSGEMHSDFARNIKNLLTYHIVPKYAMLLSFNTCTSAMLSYQLDPAGSLLSSISFASAAAAASSSSNAFCISSFHRDSMSTDICSEALLASPEELLFCS
jgi:hypothetical protein